MYFVKVKGGLINLDAVALINSDKNYVSLTNGDVIHIDGDAMEKLVEMFVHGEIAYEGGEVSVFKDIY